MKHSFSSLFVCQPVTKLYIYALANVQATDLLVVKYSFLDRHRVDMYGICQSPKQTFCFLSGLDRHHFDPDTTSRFDADPYPDPIFHFDADPDPDPHPDPGPYPSYTSWK